MKIGDRLLCTKDYIYDDERRTFTKGKTYVVTFLRNNEVRFIDDEGDEWGFTFDSFEEYLKPNFKYGK